MRERRSSWVFSFSWPWTRAYMLCCVRGSLPFCPHQLSHKGLADTFIKMRLPFESEEACALNRDIFETIYFGAVNASVEVRSEAPLLCSLRCARCRRLVMFFGALTLGWCMSVVGGSVVALLPAKPCCKPWGLLAANACCFKRSRQIHPPLLGTSHPPTYPPAHPPTLPPPASLPCIPTNTPPHLAIPVRPPPSPPVQYKQLTACKGAGHLRDIPRVARLRGAPPVRPVGRQAHRQTRLGGPEGQDGRARPQELAARGADADRLDGADPGQQRERGALHQVGPGACPLLCLCAVPAACCSPVLLR